ncbi:MAG TPA: biotin synthase BioB [Dehalococcoidia bacterium]|nr:biotin synthase BioB [Dehalococcoidia bacterium]
MDWAYLEQQLLERGEPLGREQAQALARLPSSQVPRLVALAHAVRLRRCGPTVELESLISAKTGGCPEDCAFCSQSGRFRTPVRPHPFLPLDRVLAAARDAAARGARQFCIVAAVRGPDERLMARVLQAVEAVRAETGLEVHCSLGILERWQAEALAAAGVRRYNHNLETARSFFPSVVSTHSWEERYRTCLLVKEVGMELCSGGILGMGESWDQRLEFAFQLRDLDPAEIPLNFLDPRPGTPLGERALMAPLDAIKAVAIFRLIFPDKVLRLAGGRERVLRDLQALGLLAGANGLVLGNYLTTLGRPPEEDLQMLLDLEMTPPEAP